MPETSEPGDAAILQTGRTTLRSAIPIPSKMGRQYDQLRDEGDRYELSLGKHEDVQVDLDGLDSGKHDPDVPALASATSARRQDPTCLMLLLSFNAALGGFLFGYDTGVVSGAMLQLKTRQQGLGDLTSTEQEIIVSSTIGAAIVGSVLSGECQKRFWLGRRGAILHGAVWFIVGALDMAASQSVFSITIGRIMVGVGVGVMSHTVPLYISECAPAELRGRLNALNNAFLVLGQVIASLICCMFAEIGTSQGWRYMLGLGAPPAMLLGCSFIFLPESPRYLLLRGKGDEESIGQARSILFRLRRPENIGAVDEEIRDVCQSIVANGAEGGSPVSLKQRGIRSALLLGCSLQLLQQFSGINTLMYYSSSILQMSESASGPSCMQSISASGDMAGKDGTEIRDICLSAPVAAAQLTGNLIGMLLVDRFGRRPLMLISLSGVVGSLAFLGFAFHGDGLGREAPLWAMVAYLLFFGVGIGPIPWVMNAEIYPLEVRSRCIGIATATNWIANFLVAATFLDLTEALSTDSSCPQAHPEGAFWLYGVLALVGLIGLALCMPETKGLSLEEISDLFSDGPSVN